MPMDEALTQAQHCADMTRDHLCKALHTASAIEALLLLPLIEQARRVETLLDQLINARESDASVVVDASFTPTAPARTLSPTTRTKTK